jgi:superfamily II DNA helicase RecQ
VYSRLTPFPGKDKMPTSREIAHSAVITVERKYDPIVEALITRITELEKKVAELSAAPRVEPNLKNTPLYNALREKRMSIATEMGIPAYCVATNKMLEAVVTQKPKTLDTLRSIYGFGPNKVKLYGDTFLKVVADWA